MSPFLKPYARYSSEGARAELPQLLERFTLQGLLDAQGHIHYRLEAHDGSWIESNSLHHIAAGLRKGIKLGTIRPDITRAEIEALQRKAIEERRPKASSELAGLRLEDLL